MKKTRALRATALGLSLSTVASLLTFASPAQAKPEQPLGPTSAGRQAAFGAPDAALGSGWRSSTDVLVTGAGDTDGFHLYAARESAAFEWTTVATLNAGLTGVGAWTGYTCVTGSGRYAAVVYAPAIAANKPAMLTAGAFAAIVDIETGTARRLEERVQLAYSAASCGPDERVLFTRSVGLDQQETDLIAVDASSGRKLSQRRVAAQLTNPVPAPDGDYGVVRGSLVKVGANGGLTTIGTPGGQPFALRATAAGALDLLTVQRVAGTAQQPIERAVAYRYVDGKSLKVGDGPRTELELFGLAGGRNALVGDVSGVATGRFGDLVALSTKRKARAVSRLGHLAALRVSPSTPVARRGDPSSHLKVTVQAIASGQVSAGEVATARKRPADRSVGVLAQPRAAAPIEWPQDPGPPSCAVPRNDVRIQVPQPSPNQVEWAVDLAVRGELKVRRPANYLNAGNQAYTPQGMFPLPSGGPRVPAQVMLAILAQETNMYQASWHSVPGDTGNPLVSDYYGTRSTGQLILIDYAQSDCGYGISQVTDGMRVGSNKFTLAQREAIATDYAANIAAGLQILIQKWNEVEATGTRINNWDPQYIENWFLAVWGYNSGVYQNTGSGGYGVGYLNNPANPSYPANREPFLRTNWDDASHPADWSYPEKIMGWAETPQWEWRGVAAVAKYSSPDFGDNSGAQLKLPGRYQFCSPSVNNCSPAQPSDPCPAWNDSCWWHGTTSWLEPGQSVAAQFARETLTYGIGSPEPEVNATYPRACARFPEGDEPFAVVVDDLAVSSENLLGCPGEAWGGKFTLRTGYPPGSVFSDYAQVDLHQLGAGHMGHSWFTHAYDPDHVYGGNGTRTAKHYHQVIGTWTPDIVFATDYKIVVHLQSHGAANPGAEYIIKVPGEADRECVVDQSRTQDGDEWHDVWVNLGVYRLKPGARIQLSNLIPGANGTVNVGYDAMAFVPLDAGELRTQCNTVYG